jgi:site-specific recombinase XerC
LSSALVDAVRRRRLQHNPARHAPLPRPPEPNLPCWTPADAATFLLHCAAVDPLADLFELLVGTGLRKGEALALDDAEDPQQDQGQQDGEHQRAKTTQPAGEE